MLRLEDERKRLAMQKTEKVVMEEKNSHLEELQRQDELRRIEKQRLEQMIIQGKLTVKHNLKSNKIIIFLSFQNPKSFLVKLPKDQMMCLV